MLWKVSRAHHPCEPKHQKEEDNSAAFHISHPYFVIWVFQLATEPGCTLGALQVSGLWSQNEDDSSSSPGSTHFYFRLIAQCDELPLAR